MTVYDFLDFLRTILILNEILLIFLFACLVCYGMEQLRKDSENRFNGVHHEKSPREKCEKTALKSGRELQSKEDEQHND